MAIGIHNDRNPVPGLSAQSAARNNNIAGLGASKASEKLASGKRINRSSDDAAGLIISEKLLAAVQGMYAGARNVQDGISMVQTADSALSGVTDNLSRMRELAVQAGNGILSDSDRASLNNEFQQLMQEIDRSASTANFNGQNLLDGSASGLNIETGAMEADPLSVSISAMDTASLGLAGANVLTSDNAQSAIADIDRAMQQALDQRAELGAKQNAFESEYNSLNNTAENLTSANSRIRDTDYAKEIMNLTKMKLLQKSSLSMVAQQNANQYNIMQLLR